MNITYFSTGELSSPPAQSRIIPENCEARSPKKKRDQVSIEGTNIVLHERNRLSRKSTVK